jgi:hemerythrin-like domain-containing protein
MKATEILKSEHRIIEQVLACLERMVEQVESGGALEEEHARSAVDFFRNFADRCHHGKEEVHLFPAMEARGFPRNGGPTGVMLHEHDLGRSYVRGMDQAIPGAAAGDARAQEQFVGHARAYIELLRQHIEKEDHCLFGMADQAMRAEDQQALLAAFERVEAEEMGAGTHEKYLGVADQLADHYGVARALVDAEGRSRRCGCGH